MFSCLWFRGALSVFGMLIVLSVFGQTGAPKYQKSIVDNDFYETKWRYKYTIHPASNTIIHHAGDDYQYFLYFKFDYKYQNYLNGVRLIGKWGFDPEKNQLFYPFKDNNWWTVATLDDEIMILSFEKGGATFEYHYKRVSDKEAPFKRALADLPKVKVIEKEPPAFLTTKRERLRAERQARKSARRERKTERKEERIERKSEKLAYTPPPPPIEIAVSGGGFYGGTDPILKNFVQIKSTGKLVKEFESVNRGLIKTNKQITRAELETFIQSIESIGFFELDNLYDCKNSDCHRRKTRTPMPIPLQIAIRHGNKRKVITITIWGLDKRNLQYVPYPESIDKVVQGIQKMA
ncbi:MAG: hypothetical protein AAFV80_12460, partial [Bacteroidota bacterium]